ncbi:MAG: long-chain fatty acid--CoA ligase, partial [Alphaproteobacteria bacterium]
MEYRALSGLPQMFFQQAERHGRQPFLWAKQDGTWQPLSWAEVADRVRALARGLVALGLEPGDRVALVSENRPEWLIADMAIMAAGGITVPAYTTNTVADHLHILTDSGARIAIVSTPALAKRLIPAAVQSPKAETLIAMQPGADAPAQGLRVVGWDAALAMEGDFGPRMAAIARTDTACLIYTSGTSGKPKGVMLSHGAILSNVEGCHDFLRKLPGFQERQSFLSFLPLSHSFEHTAGQMIPIGIAAEIYYAEGIDKLAGNISEVRPTIICAVPRLYETMRDRILRGVERAGGLQEKLFRKTLEVGRRAYEEPGRMGLGDRLLNALLELLVRRKVRGRFGGRLKAFVSGGAPLNYEVGLFFQALGLTILQGYGQTESSPVVSCNVPQKNKLRTVG